MLHDPIEAGDEETRTARPVADDRRFDDRVAQPAPGQVEEERLVLHDARVLRGRELEQVEPAPVDERQGEHPPRDLLLHPGQRPRIDAGGRREVGEVELGPVVVGDDRAGAGLRVAAAPGERSTLRGAAGGEDLNVADRVAADGEEERQLVIGRGLHR